MRCSEITVAEVLSYIPGSEKVTYNGVTIFDDTDTNSNFVALNLPEDFEGLVPHYELYDITQDYSSKKVYSYKVKIVDFHHCIIDIKGEK